MKDFIYQTNKNDCGFAAIKMLLAITYKNSSYLYLPTNKRENEQYTLLELKEIAKSHGLLLAGYQISDVSHLPNNKKPFIIAKKGEGNNKHAILVKRMYKKYSYIYDPNEGKKYISNKELFNGIDDKMEMLIVETSHEINTPDIKTNLVSSKDKTWLLICELGSVFAYFISAYFIKPNKHFLYPMILAVVGVILAMIYKIYTLNYMKKFDEEYISITYDNDYKIREEKYRLLHATKEGLFSNIYQIVLYISSALAVNVVLIIENYYAVFIIIASTLLTFIEVLVINPRIKKKMKEIEIDEKFMLDNKELNKDEYENAYNDIKERSYKVAKKVEMKKILSLFILLILTIFMSGIFEQANVYYVLFYFTFCLFTYTSFSNAFNMAEKNKDNIINETKFLNLINKK